MGLGVPRGSAVAVVDVDAGAQGWHWGVVVTPEVQGQLAVETDGGLAGAFREEEVGSVGGDGYGEEVAVETWSVVAPEGCGMWPGCCRCVSWRYTPFHVKLNS